MINTPRARRGMVTSPHHLASEAGLRVLREGGDAIEATIAMAAALAVVYPHMTAIGGDGFWLVAQPGLAPLAIDACGGAAAAATPELYASHGLTAVPWRGPLAANTVAGTISGWGEAFAVSREWGGRLPLSRLVEDAAWHGENGFAVTRSQQDLTAAKAPELLASPGFMATFMPSGTAPAEGSLMRFPALAKTLQRIATEGPDSFYRGALARDIAADLTAVGSPVSA
jgi:gamma-glutamyltranspeptidase